MDWAERIRKYRTMAALTQEALAERFGVDPRTVRRWEAGQTRPPETIRKKLALTPVPWLQARNPGELRGFVETHPRYLQVIRMDCTVALVSEGAVADQRAILGFSLLERNAIQFTPPSVQEIVAGHGGWSRMVTNGLASFSFEFPLRSGVDGALKDRNCRFSFTKLHFGDEAYFIGYGTKLEEFVSISPRITYGDEVHQVE